MTDVVALGAVLAVALVAAALWRRLQGRAVDAGGRLSDGTREEIGAPADGRVLLLFTAPTCGTCAAARQVLESVASQRPWVAVAEVDVATHWRVATDHGVLRAPTTLVVDERDVIRGRVSGVPDPEGLSARLAA